MGLGHKLQLDQLSSPTSHNRRLQLLHDRNSLLFLAYRLTIHGHKAQRLLANVSPSHCDPHALDLQFDVQFPACGQYSARVPRHR